MNNFSLLIMDLDAAFLYQDYQKQIMEFCLKNRLRYGFITSRNYEACHYPVNIMKLYSPFFICADSYNELYFKDYTGNNTTGKHFTNHYQYYKHYMIDENYTQYLKTDWPGTDVIIDVLKELDDCELVFNSEFYLSFYIPDIITLNVAEYILSAFNVSISFTGNRFLEICPANGGETGCLDYLAQILRIKKKSMIVANSMQNSIKNEDEQFSRIIISPYYDSSTYPEHRNLSAYYPAYPGSKGVYEGLFYFLNQETLVAH